MGCLKLLHPVMPFITEEIWQKLPGNKEKWIMTSEWPSPDEEHTDTAALEGMDNLISIITSIRNVRAFWNIPVKADLSVYVDVKGAKGKALIEDNVKYIEQFARCHVKDVKEGLERPDQSVAALVGQIRAYMPIGDTIDVEAEKKRISQKIDQMEKFLNGLNKKLSNKGFLANAPEEVVKKEEDKRKNYQNQVDNLKENIEALK